MLGAVMFISQTVAWAAIVVGAIGAGLRWALLAADRIHARPSRRPLHGGGTMRPRQRRELWLWSFYSLFVVFSGIFILDRSWGSIIARWLVVLAAGLILIWNGVVWLRFRLRHQPGG
jgi:hypothetical protein